MKSCRAMKKKILIPTKRKRLKEKQSVDMLTIQLSQLNDELHKYKGSKVSIPGLIKNLKKQSNEHRY